MSPWTHILTADEIDTRHARTAKLDARFARADREFYESRTAAQLSVLAYGAWMSNNSDTYQVALSYMAKNFPADFSARQHPAQAA